MNVIVILLVGLIGMALGGGASSTYFLTQQESIRNEIGLLKERNVKLDSERDNLLNEKISLSAAIKALEENINVLSEENKLLKSQVVNLTGDIAALTTSKKFVEDLAKRLWDAECDSVFTGGVWERLAGGGIGNEISGANITYKLEGTNLTKNVVSVNGRYTMTLPIDGRFVVAASHQNYQPYPSAPGFFVAKKCGTQTANIFLEK